MNPSELFYALLQSSFYAFFLQCFYELEPGREFLSNWHVRHLAYQLSLFADGKIKRLIINLPPRSLKSMMASIALPAFILGRDPTQRIMCVSYADPLARKLSADTRAIMQSPWFREAFPKLQFLSKRPRLADMATTLNGGRYGVGFGGGITGRGADKIILDDPMKPIDALSEADRQRSIELWEGTAATRLNDKRNGGILILMQRLHTNDLCGHLMERGGGWEIVSLPAIAEEEITYPLSGLVDDVYVRKAGELLHPEREGPEELAEIKHTLGSYHFAAQYQQTPVPISGNIIRRDWIKAFDCEAFDDESTEFTIISWDTASTLGERSDWSVGQVWLKNSGNYHLIDYERGKFEAPELTKRIIELHNYYKADFSIIEDTELGRAIAQQPRQDHRGIHVHLYKPKISKEARLIKASVQFEQGKVFVSGELHDRDTYVNELIAFPNGKHDDQVDATSMALAWLSERTSKEPQAHLRSYTIPGPTRRRYPDSHDLLRNY